MTVSFDEFEKKFDEYMDRIESGETIKVLHNDKVIAFVPYDEYNESIELIRLYTDHNEAS